MTTPDTYVTGFTLDSPPERAPKRDETVTLRGVRVPLASDVGYAFVTDCAPNRERLFSDDQIREKYDISPDAWVEIAKNKSLRLAINSESERRMLNGTAAQEAAAKIFTEAPEVLGSILRDNQASPRHRIEASKELRTVARSSDEKTGTDTDRVIVTINLGNAPEDKLVGTSNNTRFRRFLSWLSGRCSARAKVSPRSGTVLTPGWRPRGALRDAHGLHP